MTNEEVINILRREKNAILDDYLDYGGISEAFDIAIEALQRQQPSRIDCFCKCGNKLSIMFCEKCGTMHGWKTNER